jgi:hypothetical protein
MTTTNQSPASNLRVHETGAVRTTDADGVAYHLISPIGLKAVAETCREGEVKYGAFSWEKGFPASDLLNHAIAHLYNFLAGDRSEPHLPHAAWNVLAAIHSVTLWPHLNTDLRGPGCTPPGLVKAVAPATAELVPTKLRPNPTPDDTDYESLCNELIEQRDAIRDAGEGIGMWLSSALDDQNVCQEFKDAIKIWMDADPIGMAWAKPSGDPVMPPKEAHLPVMDRDLAQWAWEAHSRFCKEHNIGKPGPFTTLSPDRYREYLAMARHVALNTIMHVQCHQIPNVAERLVEIGLLQEAGEGIAVAQRRVVEKKDARIAELEKQLAEVTDKRNRLVESAVAACQKIGYTEEATDPKQLFSDGIAGSFAAIKSKLAAVTVERDALRTAAGVGDNETVTAGMADGSYRTVTPGGEVKRHWPTINADRDEAVKEVIAERDAARRELSEARAKLAEVEAGAAAMREACVDVESKIVDFEAGKINWRPDDFLERVRDSLKSHAGRDLTDRHAAEIQSPQTGLGIATDELKRRGERHASELTAKDARIATLEERLEVQRKMNYAPVVKAMAAKDAAIAHALAVLGVSHRDDGYFIEPDGPSLLSAEQAMGRSMELMNAELESLHATITQLRGDLDTLQQIASADTGVIDRLREALAGMVGAVTEPPNGKTGFGDMPIVGMFQLWVGDIHRLFHDWAILVWPRLESALTAAREALGEGAATPTSSPAGGACAHESATYSKEHDNYYCDQCKQGMGQAYYSARIMLESSGNAVRVLNESVATLKARIAELEARRSDAERATIDKSIEKLSRIINENVNRGVRKWCERNGYGECDSDRDYWEGSANIYNVIAPVVRACFEARSDAERAWEIYAAKCGGNTPYWELRHEPGGFEWHVWYDDDSLAKELSTGHGSPQAAILAADAATQQP